MSVEIPSHPAESRRYTKEFRRFHVTNVACYLDSVAIGRQQAMSFKEALGGKRVAFNAVENGEAIEGTIHAPGTETMEIGEPNATRAASQRILFQIEKCLFDSLQKLLGQFQGD